MSNPPAPAAAKTHNNVLLCVAPPSVTQYRAVDDFPGLNPVFDIVTRIYKVPVRSTSLRTRTNCTREYLFRYRYGLEKTYNYASALEKGSWFHKAVEGIYKGGDYNKVVEALEEEFQANLDKYLDLAEEDIMPDGKSVGQAFEEWNVDFHKAMAMAKYFCTVHCLVPEGFDVLQVEKRIFAKVKDIPRVITGVLDFIAEETATGFLWLIDHKTTSMVPYYVADAMDLDLQPHHHRLLAMAEYPDRQVVGVIHNILQVPTIKYCPKTKDAGGPQAYADRVTEWYEARCALGKYDSRKLPAVRSKVRFLGDMPPSDYMSLLKSVATDSHRLPVLTNYPRCMDSYTCRGKYGRPCDFLPFCREEETKNWPHILKQGFKVKDLTVTEETPCHQ